MIKRYHFGADSSMTNVKSKFSDIASSLANTPESSPLSSSLDTWRNDIFDNTKTSVSPLLQERINNEEFLNNANNFTSRIPSLIQRTPNQAPISRSIRDMITNGAISGAKETYSNPPTSSSSGSYDEAEVMTPLQAQNITNENTVKAQEINTKTQEINAPQASPQAQPQTPANANDSAPVQTSVPTSVPTPVPTPVPVQPTPVANANANAQPSVQPSVPTSVPTSVETSVQTSVPVQEPVTPVNNGASNTMLSDENAKDIKGDRLNDLTKVQSYLYNYKEGFGEDPNQTHYGPMAQDLEKIYPDVVKEEQGLKKVDTDRLALNLAGDLGAIAEEVIQLRKKMDRLSKARRD